MLHQWTASQFETVKDVKASKRTGACCVCASHTFSAKCTRLTRLLYCSCAYGYFTPSLYRPTVITQLSTPGVVPSWGYGTAIERWHLCSAHNGGTSHVWQRPSFCGSDTRYWGTASPVDSLHLCLACLSHIVDRCHSSRRPCVCGSHTRGWDTANLQVGRSRLP